jgi:hypothetical protein
LHTISVQDQLGNKLEAGLCGSTESGESSGDGDCPCLSAVTDGYLVTIDSVSQFTLFGIPVLSSGGGSDEITVTWDDFVQFPYEIHTKKTLHYLATRCC